MSKNIKYRAWDSEDKKFLNNDKYVIGRFRENTIAFTIYIDNKTILGYPSIEREKDIILMQFTGLTDRNGVDVFEGDIIKYTDDDSMNYNRLCVIEWHKYGIYCLVKRFLKERDGFGSYQFNYLNNADEIEVIGNIYQNKEFLIP